jgi:hypothetical protein
MQPLPRHRSSAAEELEVIAPSKLAIENVSKSFKGGSGAVLALDRLSLARAQRNSRFSRENREKGLPDRRQNVYGPPALLVGPRGQKGGPASSQTSKFNWVLMTNFLKAGRLVQNYEDSRPTDIQLTFESRQWSSSHDEA